MYNTDDDEIDLNNRDDAIKLLIKLKRRKARKFNKKIILDIDVINEYNKNGLKSIVKMFNKNYCYLYETEFIYNVLFYCYKYDLKNLEKIIKNYDKIN